MKLLFTISPDIVVVSPASISEGVIVTFSNLKSGSPDKLFTFKYIVLLPVNLIL